MASVAYSVGDVLPIRNARVRPAVRPVRKWTALELQRAIAEATGGFLFFGILGWEAWRIGGRLLQLGILMAAGATGSVPVVHADFMWPSSGPWPW